VTSARGDVITGSPPPRDHVIAGVGVPPIGSHDTLSVSPGRRTSRVVVDDSRSFGAAAAVTHRSRQVEADYGRPM